MQTLSWTLAAVVGAMALALMAVAIVHAGFVRAGRRSLVPAELAVHAHRPFQVFSGRTVLQLSRVAFEGRVRKELEEAVDAHPRWDRHVCKLHVTGATDGVVRLRALISAADAGALWICAVAYASTSWPGSETSSRPPCRVRAPK